MRYSPILVAAALVAAVGCQRRQAPEASSTQITAAEVERAPAPSAGSVDEAELKEFRDNARRDLLNLERRIQYLEVRAASPGAPPEARIEIEQARAKHGALSRAIDDLRPGSWQGKRDALDQDWEEASTITDSVSSTLTDDAR
jgi:hypothetical protein